MPGEGCRGGRGARRRPRAAFARPLSIEVRLFLVLPAHTRVYAETCNTPRALTGRREFLEGLVPSSASAVTCPRWVLSVSSPSERV